ncbi:MAG: hypothetical protein IJ909_09880 [Fibrobacter sp.]|nr:hypothetical protein [Fibrobacter sp.]
MKQKFSTSSWSRKVTGSMATIAAAALAISLVACDDSSSSPSSDDLDGLSSETVTSSETNGNSSDSNGNSATSQNGNSSASVDESSSSTETSSSSNSVATCSHLTDSNCRISEGCSPTPCMPGTKVLDCATNSEYVCKSGSWQLAETCANISGISGNDRWNCDEDDFTLLPDCKADTITYMCVSNHWFKTDDCDPTKPYCGYDDYTLCLKTTLKKYCLKTDWLNESCSYGKDPMRWLYTYNDPEDDYPSNQIRYSCNQSGKWEEFVQQCDPMMDCGNGNNKSDDHGILPDGAPCTNEGEQMTVESYNYQCINYKWTRL